MWTTIQHIDESILHWIHIDRQDAFFDTVMPWLRNPYFWSPVYFFLLVWMMVNWRWRGFWWCIYFLAVFAFCDFSSASIIKPFVHRLRPCNEPNLSFVIREIVVCGRGFSFPSAHAANHFGLSFFIYHTLGRIYSWLKIPVMIWAFLVCYAQMYVCVHYPSDILVGGLLGSLVGCWVAYLFNRRGIVSDKDVNTLNP